MLKVTELVRGRVEISTYATSNLWDLAAKQGQVWDLEGGGLSFPQPETTRSAANTIVTRLATIQCYLLAPSANPPLGLEPWDCFLPPRRAPGPTSAVTSLLHEEEGAGMRSQGKGGKKFRAQLVSLTQCRFA